MMERKTSNGCLYASGSQIYQRTRSYGSLLDRTLPSLESPIDLRIGFLVEGLIALGTFMGIGMLAVLIRAGWLH